jgi:hypothetical protein
MQFTARDLLTEVLPAPMFRSGGSLNIIVPPDCGSCTKCTDCTHCSNKCTQGCNTCGTGQTKTASAQELISHSDLALLLEMITRRLPA